MSTERVRSILAFDLRHEYVLAGGSVHIKRDYGTYLCGYDPAPDEIVETTAWPGEGPWCFDCLTEVPEHVRWVEPIPALAPFQSVFDLCAQAGIPVEQVEELPVDMEADATPCGAALRTINPPVICALGHDEVHELGVLHELTHLVCAPYGWSSEVGCGFYAVQYALAVQIANNTHLKQSTLDVQGTGCTVFGGILQARAWALGLLNSHGLPQPWVHRLSQPIPTRQHK